MTGINRVTRIKWDTRMTQMTRDTGITEITRMTGMIMTRITRTRR